MKKDSSPSKSAIQPAEKSTANLQQSFAPNAQPRLFPDDPPPIPGSMNDAHVVRAALVETIRACGKSRETLAGEMSALTGAEITVTRINGFTAESREDRRFPLELLRAFCTATGDFNLLRSVAERSGFRLINDVEWELLNLGREYLKQKRASEKADTIEQRLSRIENL